MNTRDRVKLLFGPYRPPALRRGDRATCLYRDCDVVITGWTAARIGWPRCRALDSGGGGSGLLVDEELAHAIRQESAAAVMHWWGVANNTVVLWRHALGVDRVNNPGSHRLILAASQEGAQRVRGRNLQTGYHGAWWAKDDLALLGTMPDEEVAARTGKTLNAVHLKRQRLGIAGYRPPDAPDRFWAPEEIALLGTATDREVARRLGRSLAAVRQKRRELGVPLRFDGRRCGRSRQFTGEGHS